MTARHPVATFYLLAYLCSWAIAVPLALQAQGILAVRVPFALHYLSGLGPAVAALATTRVLRRTRPRDRDLDVSSRIERVRRWHWILLGALAPLMLFEVARLAGRASGQQVPSWMALGQVNFLPDLGFGAWALWLVANGWGEELGWRGFALPRLQRSHSALGSSVLLSVAWAGWHLPAFFYVPSYAALGLRVLPGFFIGILAGAIVLTWLYNSSHGSVLAVVFWHASFNYVSASPNAGGFAAALTSTLVILWAVAIVWRYRGGDPRGVLEACHAGRCARGRPSAQACCVTRDAGDLGAPRTSPRVSRSGAASPWALAVLVMMDGWARSRARQLSSN